MLMDSELNEYLGDPAAFRSMLGARAQRLTELAALEPPYFIDVRAGMPPISTWAAMRDVTASEAHVGDRLAGAPGAPGQAVGRARIVLDPEHAGDVGPGDILVTDTTDPAWTPLFLSVAGVVTTGGALISHAAIVSRELGVPCVVSCRDATALYQMEPPLPSTDRPAPFGWSRRSRPQ